MLRQSLLTLSLIFTISLPVLAVPVSPRVGESAERLSIQFQRQIIFHKNNRFAIEIVNGTCQEYAAVVRKIHDLIPIFENRVGYLENETDAYRIKHNNIKARLKQARIDERNSKVGYDFVVSRMKQLGCRSPYMIR